jgi:hypothetical protein
VYLFAIVFKSLTKGSDVGDIYYGDIPTSMSTLLLEGVLPDQAKFVRTNGDGGWLTGALSLIFVLMASLLVMNMLIGLLCEVVGVISAVEKEQLLVNHVKQQLQSILGNKEVTREEFVGLLTNSASAKTIQDLGVDVSGLIDYFELIFAERDELSFSGFMELVLELRGSNTATVKDIIDLRKVISSVAMDVRQIMIGQEGHMPLGQMGKCKDAGRPSVIHIANPRTGGDHRLPGSSNRAHGRSSLGSIEALAEMSIGHESSRENCNSAGEIGAAHGKRDEEEFDSLLAGIGMPPLHHGAGQGEAISSK